MKKQAGRVWYTVYDKATGQAIGCGDSKDCARAMGVKDSSFYAIISKAAHGDSVKYEVYKEILTREEMKECQL